MRATFNLIACLLLAACGRAPPETPRTADGFPKADRPVSPVVSSRWSSEPDRDGRREAETVMQEAGIAPGMTVADLGAGEGYYTTRLARRVGAKGRVLAEDIVPAYRDALAARVYRERLDNVSVRLGKPADPRLPEHSFDRVMMVHMYHEIAEPYEFLWRMRPALAEHGRVVVVDADRTTGAHGTPPALLDCEFAAVGYTRVAQVPMPQAGGYLAMYEARGPRPDARSIKACRA
jgi:ubiquinone/menaquinone biosynthesis C-methylase UbiE